MKKSIRISTCVLILITILSSCKVGRISKNNSHATKGNRREMFILHDDFSNLFGGNPLTGSWNQSDMEAAAHILATSGADIISLSVSLGELCYYYPAVQGENINTESENISGQWWIRAQQLYRKGIDPYGIVLTEIRRHGVPVLAKFRVNDRHHITGNRPYLASKFWSQHPQWYIGHNEQGTEIMPRFQENNSIGPLMLTIIGRDRPRLLDYAVPEVREKRLAIFREVIERYNVAGATLNFLREPFCISFPEKNAVYLTQFVRQCRTILDEVLRAKRVDNPILEALVPWDINFCCAMGMEVDVWMKEGLIDFVSPSEGWTTDFNMDIRPWMDLAKNTRCKVYPGFNGLIAADAELCIPDEYKIENSRAKSATIRPEHVRALAHRFYAEGADGLSAFNLYSGFYKYLFPLSELIAPDHLNAGDRFYIFMKEPLYRQYSFLKLSMAAESQESRSIQFRMHERLKDSQAQLCFKAKGLDDIADLVVSVNGRKIPSERFTCIPHSGSEFLYLQCRLVPDEILENENEIVFSPGDKLSKEVLVQETEIRVHPLTTEN